MNIVPEKDNKMFILTLSKITGLSTTLERKRWPLSASYKMCSGGTMFLKHLQILNKIYDLSDCSMSGYLDPNHSPGFL